MERAELLIIVFLGMLVFLSECPTGSVAAKICPLRAEPVYPAQENGIVRCACARPFFGKNCRYKQQNGTIALNATRLTEKTVLMKWKENAEPNEERRYLISVRKVEFKLSTVKLYKWQKASIEYIKPSSTFFTSQQETESRDDLSQKKMYNDYTAVLRLPGNSSYEVKITTLTTAGKHVGSTSVFFDASDAFVNGTMLGISEKMDNFKNYLFDSFEDACALKGIVIGVVVGSLGTLMIIAMVYVLSRYCCKCKKRGDSSGGTLDATSENSCGQTSGVKIPEPCVIVDILGFDPVSTDITGTTQPAESKERVTVEVDNPAFSPAEPDVVTEDVPEPEAETDDTEPEQPEVIVEPKTINTEDEPRTI